MKHTIVWQGQQDCDFLVEGEWSVPLAAAARPVVSFHRSGITVGFFYRNTNGYGHWYSSNTCPLATAWRIAQILPKVKRLREGSGYDATLCGLVITLQGDRHEERLKHLAKDLDMSVDDLLAELGGTWDIWPGTEEMVSMWERLPSDLQDANVRFIRTGLAYGHFEPDARLNSYIHMAELRIRTALEQKQHEDDLIEADLTPEQSLRQLLEDLGVNNLAYTVGCGDIGEPSHFGWDMLDKELMREMIGSRGYASYVPLISTAKQPDDPTAHYSSGSGGVSIFGSDFGDHRHPPIKLGQVWYELVNARFDRVTERVQVAIRPLGSTDADEAEELQSVSDLRARIGETNGLAAPLAPGAIAPGRRQPGRFDKLLGKR
jgi:hypothetical protein